MSDEPIYKAGPEYQTHGRLFMVRFVDWARGHITSGKLRHALYCGLIEEFELLGMYDFGDCSIMDSHFKEAYDEMHEYEEEE